ncbi:MAG: hypothetical protein ACLPVO_12135 [Desulfomonilaceae bacterium]|jgi:hypothetical protein
MLSAEETLNMLQAAKVSEPETCELARKILLWVKNLLKPETLEETELYVEDPGEEIYLFSDNILMVVKRPKTDPKTHVSFYPLEMIESCGLIMNGLNEEGEIEKGSNGEIIKNGDIELEFKIGDKPFKLHSKKTSKDQPRNYVKNLIDILNNKLLPNLLGTCEDSSAQESTAT